MHRPNPNTCKAEISNTVRINTADTKSTMMNIEGTGMATGRGMESTGRNLSSESFLILTRRLKLESKRFAAS